MRLGTHAARTCAALLLTGVLCACAASSPPRATSDSRAAVPEPVTVAPRGDRGNPPFYDVLGKRYHVLPSSSGYVERGIASWYGRDFHGLSTSSGEVYDMNAMTAAHTTLPLPTWAEVTNLANGKHVVVKVNDRGPFVDNRLIDLSYAAATALDIVRDGTARVEVRAIAPQSGSQREPTFAAAAPAPLGMLGAPAPAPVPATPPPADRMFVQVGAFSQADNAARLVARLRASGFGDTQVVTQPDGRRILHRVRLGPIRDAGEFDALSARLLAIGVGGSRLVVDHAQ